MSIIFNYYNIIHADIYSDVFSYCVSIYVVDAVNLIYKH